MAPLVAERPLGTPMRSPTPKHGLEFPKQYRLLHRREFLVAQSKARRVHAPHFTLLLCDRADAAPARIGITASRKAREQRGSKSHPTTGARSIPVESRFVSPRSRLRGDRSGKRPGPCVCRRARRDSARAGSTSPRPECAPHMIRSLLLWLLRAYRLTLSPFLGNACRFEPSCSRYASACIERFGAVHGSWLSVRRLCKCHPFHPGGYDPPPALPNADVATTSAGQS